MPELQQPTGASRLDALARNQLVWLEALAWAQIENRAWDEQAQQILAHWRSNRLPLVVCRQHAQTPPNHVCVGLPAPWQWSRRRLALTVSRKLIANRGAFPSLLQVAQANHWGPAAHDLSDALAVQGAQVYVYGSYAWQLLTGLAYVHADSDIDLSLHVSSLAAAFEVAQQLETVQLPQRIDGEIVFPAGQAILWRELQRLRSRQTSKAMVKDRHGIWLAALNEVLTYGHGERFSDPKTAVAWHLNPL